MVLRVAVVGGGLMGAAAAWSLSARGHRVTVLERFGPGHDRGSSYGTSRIFRLAYAEPSYTELALRALPLWRRLEEESGQPVLTLTGAVDHGLPRAVDRLADVLAGAGRSAPAPVSRGGGRPVAGAPGRHDRAVPPGRRPGARRRRRCPRC
ncbi:Monomeric sarcosine oxidase [Streptomyces microflavus]